MEFRIVTISFLPFYRCYPPLFAVMVLKKMGQNMGPREVTKQTVRPFAGKDCKLACRMNNLVGYV